MLALSLERVLGETPLILCLGAHCDDVEIGCGGTLLHLRERIPGARFQWAVMSSTGVRRREVEASARLFLGESEGSAVLARDFRDGFLPYEGARVKDYFEELKRELQPDLVFTHNRDDLHQDHRLVAELTWNTWRDHLILEYEVPKWDGDLGRPSAYVPLSAATVERKIELIEEAYGSQRPKDWFDPELFRGLMRVRGMEARAPEGYAEAFFARKLLLS